MALLGIEAILLAIICFVAPRLGASCSSGIHQLSLPSSAGALQGSILAVGFEDGDVAFWEFRRTAWECVKTIKGTPHFCQSLPLKCLNM